MGAKLLEFYDKAKQLGGLKGSMRMAMLTLIPSSKAMEAPDSLENITKFKNAMVELQKEFK